MVVLRFRSSAAVFWLHGFHTCYLSLYLSNEFAVLKETILLLFATGATVKPSPGFSLFLGRNGGGFAGKM
jgi:hypothetical protein